MADAVKRAKHLRRLKKAGHIGLIATSSIIAITLVISLLPRGRDTFSIRIDNLDTPNHYTMSATRDGKGTTYLRADPAPKTKTWTAEKLENYLLEQGDKLEGSQNFVDDDTYTLALVYTVYLTNQSSEEEQVALYNVKLDSYRAPSNEAELPIDYFRILVQSEVVGDPSSLVNTYYGQIRTSYKELNYHYVTAEDNDAQSREAISTVSKKTDANMNNYLESEFISKGNDGYCVNFDNFELNGGYLVNSAKLNIPSGKTMRYTFAAYFEGEDLDHKGQPPRDSYLLLSLHFGI